jgi:hypothetical protein
VRLHGTSRANDDHCVAPQQSLDFDTLQLKDML